METKILLVEDDEGHAELITLNLRNGGVTNEVLHFTDGLKAIEFLRTPVSSNNNTKYLMILDLNMPRLNGVDVLHTLKTDTSTKNIPIVILTTANDTETIEYCYEYGCNAFVTKPVDYESFCKAIQELGAFVNIANLSGNKKESRLAACY